MQNDPWSQLKALTTARIALGRTGTAIPLEEVLRFRLAHANARDAVHAPLDIAALQQQLNAFQLPVPVLHSSARDRYEYLQRPDKGRVLDSSAVQLLSSLPAADVGKEVAFIIADGLSATAVNKHVYPLLQQLIPLVRESGLSIAPLTIVQQGRVAIGDEIGALLQVKAAIVLIGERPGLSAPDSLGIYLTWHPRKGLTDEARNCISNIRPEGLPYQAAAEKAFYLLRESLRLRLSGVRLKDNEKQLR